ncbi:MAG: hypothetical protein H7A24_05495 [Leptospiraceae bacterium]|nr:hypothetical protein [Leptospiraceae bacterium]MCP5511312.1 hypothetical protein [Leptospiraceae bacterium]
MIKSDVIKLFFGLLFFTLLEFCSTVQEVKTEKTEDVPPDSPEKIEDLSELDKERDCRVRSEKIEQLRITLDPFHIIDFPDEDWKSEFYKTQTEVWNTNVSVFVPYSENYQSYKNHEEICKKYGIDLFIKTFVEKNDERIKVRQEVYDSYLHNIKYFGTEYYITKKISNLNLEKETEMISINNEWKSIPKYILNRSSVEWEDEPSFLISNLQKSDKGYLDVYSEEPNSTLYLDSKNFGKLPGMGIELSSGFHDLEIISGSIKKK